MKHLDCITHKPKEPMRPTYIGGGYVAVGALAETMELHIAPEPQPSYVGDNAFEITEDAISFGTYIHADDWRNLSGEYTQQIQNRIESLIAREVRKSRQAEIYAISDLLAGKLSINSADVVSSALVARIAGLE